MNQTEDLATLIDNLYETNTEVLNDSLQQLILFCQSNDKDDIIPYFQSLFEKFPLLLLDENLSVPVQASQLLIEINNQFGQEAEPYFQGVIENLIINLADPKPVIRKMASNTICSFITATKNHDLIYSNLAKYGILHANPQVRQKSIMSINNFVLADPTCIANSSAFKLAIDKVIEKSNESIDTVKAAACQIITHLNNNYKSPFTILMKKFSYTDQEKIKKIIESAETVDSHDNSYSHSKSPLRTQNGGQEPERSETPRRSSEAADSPNRVQKTFKMTTKKSSLAPLNTGKNTLKYGLFETRIIEDANNAQDWRVRLAATEEMIKTIESLHSTDALVSHLDDFFSLMLNLMNDVNFKIYINSLNTIGIVIKLTSKNELAPHIDRVIEALLGKLGDSKVAARQIAFQILAIAAKKIDTQDYLRLVFENLKQTNWHMREESLLLIQTIFNSIQEDLPQDVYEETAENVIEILDDTKPKVRNTARETIVCVLRHSPNSLELLSHIESMLERELYEYIYFRIQNPDNYPRNTYTPYTDDSAMDQRESLTLAHKADSTGGLGDNGRTASNINFRSMTTSPRDVGFPNTMNRQTPPNLPNIRQMSGHSNHRQNMDTVYSASPYKKHSYEQTSQFQGNSTSYSSASSNTYYGNEHSRYGNKYNYAGTPYDKRQPEPEAASPNLSNFGTPYTKGNVYTPESNQRSANSYNNQSGYYPKVQTPYQNNHKSGYEISTASSSRSAYSRNTNANTIYSFENSMSNSSVLEKAKRQPMYAGAGAMDSRIQSAQAPIDMATSIYGADKRILSTAEDQGKSGFTTMHNKLSKATPVPNRDSYLEYSMAKKLDDFTAGNFENQSSLTNLEYPPEMGGRSGEVFSSIDSLPKDAMQHDNRFKAGNTNNPYRGGTRPDLTQKLKRLQAQQNQVIMETDESRKTLVRDEGNERGKQVEKKPPLPLHKRGTSQAPKETEKDDAGSDEDNSFSAKGTSKPLKKKATPQRNSEGPAVVDYKKLEYLTRDQLEPIEGNLESTLRQMNNDSKSDDWQRQFEASNIFRRFLQFHSSFLTTSLSFNLHTTTQDILRMVESLRSNLAKNALITLTEMCIALKKQLDAEAEMVIAKLIKKGSDANSFISEEVRKAFVAVSQNCSETKIIPILVSILNQKATPAKLNICLCVEAIITKNENRVNQVRDFDRMVIILGNYLLDSAVEVRNAAKQAMSILLKFLFNQTEVDKILQRNFTEANYNRINNIVTKELNQGNSALMITNYSATVKSRTTSFKPKSTNSKNSIEDEEEGTPQLKEMKETKDSPLMNKSKKLTKGGTKDQELENLPNVFAQAEATDWKSRYDAAQSLKDVGTKSADNLCKSRFQLKYFDSFTRLILDSNTKVASFAISSFSELVPTLKPGIEANVTIVLNAAMNCLGSVNPAIKATAEGLFDKLTEYIDLSVLIPVWTSCLPFTNIKAKVVILNRLNDLCPTLYSKKPGVVTKNVIPALSKCIEETKAEVKNNTYQVLQTLYGVMNKELLEYVPANKAQIVFDIVAGK